MDSHINVHEDGKYRCRHSQMGHKNGPGKICGRQPLKI